MVVTTATLNSTAKDWPCPVASDISPCTCSEEMGEDSFMTFYCVDVTDMQVIQSVFRKPFPFSNLGEVIISVQDQYTWEDSVAVDIPANIFSDKSFKRIYFSMKVRDIHEHAFESSKDVLEDLFISGGFCGNCNNELEFFPMHMLEGFPNLRYFILQETSLKDDTFAHHFDQLYLPNIESMHITKGQLTHIPKFPTAPKLRDLRFCYNPIATIEQEAFADLESLEWLDLAGNGANQTLTHLETDSLKLNSTNFLKLDFGYFNSLTSFSPGFISNIQPNTVFDFLDNNIMKIEEEAFRDILEVMKSGNGTINMGRNPLLCDCSIEWLISEPELLAVITRGKYEFMTPVCKDGTPVEDLDPQVFQDLCP